MNAPTISDIERARAVAESQYGLTVTDLKKLDGYISHNVRITDKSGTQYVLKLYPNDANERALVVAENRTLLHLGKTGIPCSQPLPNADGDYIGETEAGFHRLLTFVKGTFLAEAKGTTELACNFGKFLAGIAIQLQDIYDPVIASRQFNWDLDRFITQKEKLEAIPKAGDRSLARYFFQQYETFAFHQVHALRKQVIHGDANDWNVLVNDKEISGIIDFGDLAYSSLINEVAIAGAYLAFLWENPLEGLAPFLEGFHSVYPLEEAELDVLYYLIAGRLVTSVSNSNYDRREQPDNEYISVSEKQALELLYKWIRISPKQAANAFRAATGFPKIDQSCESLYERRMKHTSAALSTSYQAPIHFERAAFQFMYTAEGTTYLDAYNNIPHVGHSHPHVVEAARQQQATLNTNTRYLSMLYSDYSEHLLSYFPEQLNKVFFVNSGSAANDLAIRLAKAHTGGTELMVMEHGYHGNTQTSLDLSAYKYKGKGGSGKAAHIIELPLPDLYRGEPHDSKSHYSREATEQLKVHLNKGRQLAAFIAEPIVGCGGQVPLPPNYLMELYPAVREAGGLCISDEVQVGFGRLGSHFWGFEKYGVVPDIVVLGKPMGNGHPMAAVVTTTAIAQSFETGMEFFSSFGGNNVSCALGKAVLEVIEKEQLQANALDTGNYFMEQLRSLQQKFPVIGDVRGSGLFIGIELVEHNASKTPNTQLAKAVKEHLKSQHILISTDGPHNNVLKSKPPLCFNKGNVDEVIAALDLAFTELIQS